jgi:hypothetical protein
MQIGTAEGNISAREVTGAVALGERFAETLRREAYAWTDVALPAPHLNAAPQQWHTLTPAPVDQNGLPAAAAGVPGSNLPRQRFCVHYWIDPLQDQTYGGVMNARVRVIWPRAQGDNGQSLANFCQERGAAAFEQLRQQTPDQAVRDWYTLTVPATIRRHPK